MKRRSNIMFLFFTALFFSISILCLQKIFVNNRCKTTSILAEELICKKSEEKNIGLMLTKDYGNIIYEWARHSKHFFTGMIILDGSTSSSIARSIFDCKKSASSSFFYYHESDFSTFQNFQIVSYEKWGISL